MVDTRSSLSGLMAVIAAAVLAACGVTVPGQEGDGDDDDDNTSTTGTLKLLVAGDSAASIQKITLDVGAAEVHEKDGDWITISENVGLVTLVDASAKEQTLAEKDLTHARFDSVRLTLDGGTVIDGEGDELELNIPDSSATLTIETEFCVVGDETTKLILDFNAEQNIEDAGTGYTMVPAVVVSDDDSCSGYED